MKAVNDRSLNEVPPIENVSGLHHLVCHSCATARHGTDIDPRDAPHEVLTDSGPLLELFQLAHWSHDTTAVAL